MKSIGSFAILGALFLTLLGCATQWSNLSPTRPTLSGRNFVSKVIPDAMPADFARILVVLKTSRPSGSYAQNFLTAIPTAYQTCTMGLDPLQPSAHNATVRQKIAECESDVVLTIEQVYRDDLGSLLNEDYPSINMEMRSATTNLVFWRGVATKRLITSSQFPARAIVSRLVRDGVLDKNPSVVQNLP